MTRHLSSNITQAVKKGFSSPDASWFRGESIDFLRRTLLDGDARIYEVLDRQAIVPLIEQHLNGEENRRLFIWSLLNVEAWMDQNLV